MGKFSLNLQEESGSASSDGLVSPPRNLGRELPHTGARETGGGSKYQSLRARENRVSLPARLQALDLSPIGDIAEGN